MGWVERMGDAGLRGVVGGIALGGPIHITRAFVGNEFEGMSDQKFAFIAELATDKEVKLAWVNNIKTLISQGLITKQDGEARIAAVNRFVDIYTNLGPNLTKKNRKRIFALANQNLTLEDLKAQSSMNPGEKAKIDEQIKNIDNEIKKIGEKLQPTEDKELDLEYEGKERMDLIKTLSSPWENLTDTQKQQKIELFNQEIDNVRQALGNFMVKDGTVQVFTNRDEYIAAIKKADPNAEINDKQSATVLMNKDGKAVGIFVDATHQGANIQSLYHEAFHPVVQQVFKSNPEMFVEFQKMVDDNLRDMGMALMADELQAFADQYQKAPDGSTIKQLRGEEFLVQYASYLSQKKFLDTLTPAKKKSLLQKIAAWFNKAFSKIVGKKVKVVEPENAIEFITQMANRMAEGKDVTSLAQKFKKEVEARGKVAAKEKTQKRQTATERRKAAIKKAAKKRRDSKKPKTIQRQQLSDKRQAETDLGLRNKDGSLKRYLRTDAGYRRALARAQEVNKKLREEDSPYKAAITKVSGEKGDKRDYYGIHLVPRTPTMQREQKMSPMEKEYANPEVMDNGKERLTQRQSINDNFAVDYFVDSADKKLLDQLEKDGLLEYAANLLQFAGMETVTTIPDNMVVGNVMAKSKGGKWNKIIDANGGVVFVLKYGDIWASSREDKAKILVNMLNKNLRESKDGIGRFSLISAVSDKLITSNEGAMASMRLLETLVDRLDMRSAFRTGLIQAGKKFEKDGTWKKMNVVNPYQNVGTSSAALTKAVEDGFFKMPTSTFVSRGTFVENVINEMGIAMNALGQKDASPSVKKLMQQLNEYLQPISQETGKPKKITKFAAKSILESFGSILTERILRGLPKSHIYAVIEYTNPVGYVEMKEHPSYPYHIRQLNADGTMSTDKTKTVRPKLNLLKTRPLYNMVLNMPMSQGGFTKAQMDAKKKGGTYYGVVGGPQQVNGLGMFKPANKLVAVEKSIDKRFEVDSPTLTQRQQIIGKKADLTPEQKNALEEAEVLEKSGLTPQEIYDRTGWERGKDDKWRHELPPSQLTSLARDVINNAPQGETQHFFLGEILDAPELKKAYPDMFKDWTKLKPKDVDQTVTVEVTVRPAGAENAWYYPDTQTIEINTKDAYRVPTLLVHELQHHIQFIEDFAKGGNYEVIMENIQDIVTPKIQKELDALETEIKQLDNLSTIAEFADERHPDTPPGELFTADFLNKHYDDILEVDASAIEDYYRDRKNFKTVRGVIENAYIDGGWFDVIDRLHYGTIDPLKEKRAKYGPYALYQRLAGEVESRNVETRMSLSPSGRKKRMLRDTEDYSREDQILLKPTTESDPLTQRQQIIGENAELAQNVRDNLKVARDMEAAKKSAKEISLATGWQKGADGKWRYEVSDIEITGDVSPWQDNYTGAKGHISKLGDLISKKSKLLEAYPQLANKVFVVRGLPSNVGPFTFGAMYKESRGTYGIYLSDGLFNPLGTDKVFKPRVAVDFGTSVLAHELQHVVQDIEGFSKGWQMSYRKSAGETEARNVQKRMGMTEAQRRKTLLEETEDVAREDQEVYFRDEEMAQGQLTQRQQLVGEKHRRGDLLQREQMGLFGKGLTPEESSYLEGALEVSGKAYSTELKKYPKARRYDQDVLDKARAAAKAASMKYLIDAYVKQKQDPSARFLLKTKRMIKEGGVPQKILDLVLRSLGETTIASIPVNRLLGIREQAAQTREELSQYKREVKLKGRGAKDLQAIKKKMGVRIRELLPKGNTLFTYKELKKIMSSLESATDLDGVETQMEEIMDMVIKKVTTLTHEAIEKALSIKTFKQDAKGKRTQKSLALNQQEMISLLQKYALKGEATLKQIEDLIATLEAEVNPKDPKMHEDTLEALEVARMYRAAMNLEDGSVGKLNDLIEVLASVKEIIKTGQTIRRQEAAERSAQYSAEAEMLYADIMGDALRVSLGKKIDFKTLTPAEKKLLKSIGISEKQKSAEVKLTRSTIKKINKAATLVEVSQPKYSDLTAEERMQKDVLLKNKKEQRERHIRGALNSLSKHFAKRDQSMPYWVDIISKTSGQIMDTISQQLITERLNESSYIFKQGMEDINAEVEAALKKFFGKKWKTVNIDNREIIDTGISFKSPAGVSTLRLSLDEIAYLYNQYKNPETHPAFESAGLTPEIMEQLTDFLMEDTPSGKKDSALKQWADWQVDVLFPKLYNRYNETYRDIFGTNMPWNMVYAGKLYRTGAENNKISSLLENQKQYKMSIGSPGSTLVRKGGSAPISLDVGINDALFTYLQEMEYFRAYSRNLKNIIKLIENPDIKRAIEINDADIYPLIKSTVELIAKGGKTQDAGQSIVKKMQDVFVTSRLGLNPNVGLKQITSAFTYSNDIGLTNWLDYTYKSMGNILETWDEIYDNSIYIRERYGKDIRKSIEAYARSGDMIKFAPSKYLINTESAVNFMMGLVKQGDKMGIMGGIPNYLFYKDEFFAKNPTGSESQAIKYAIKKFQRDTKLTQQSTDIVDRSWYQQQGGWYKFFTMFKTAILGYSRKEMQAGRHLIRAAKGQPHKGSVGRLIYQLLLYHSALPVVFQYVALWFPGILTKWDEEDRDSLIKAGILGSVNSIYLLGDIFKALVAYAEKKPWGRDLGGQMLGPLDLIFDIGKLIVDLYQLSTAEELTDEEKEVYTEKLVKAVAMIGEVYKGIPIQQAIKWIKNIYKVTGGESKVFEETMMRILNASEYQILGIEGDEEGVSTTLPKTQSKGRRIIKGKAKGFKGKGRVVKGKKGYKKKKVKK